MCVSIRHCMTPVLESGCMWPPSFPVPCWFLHRICFVSQQLPQIQLYKTCHQLKGTQCNLNWWKWKSPSRVRFFATPWILQARILEWVTFPLSRGIPNPEIEPRSLALQAGSLPPEPPGKPKSKPLVHTISSRCWVWLFSSKLLNPLQHPCEFSAVPGELWCSDWSDHLVTGRGWGMAGEIHKWGLLGSISMGEIQGFLWGTPRKSYWPRKIKQKTCTSKTNSISS